jgi:hypothetical protein
MAVEQWRVVVVVVVLVASAALLVVPAAVVLVMMMLSFCRPRPLNVTPVCANRFPAKYAKGQTSIEYAFTSCTKTVELLGQPAFLGKKGEIAHAQHTRTRLHECTRTLSHTHVRMHALTQFFARAACTPARTNEPGKRTMFAITTNRAVDVKLFSAFPCEEELLLPPGVPLEIKSFADLGNGLTHIQCEEDASAPEMVVGWHWAAAGPSPQPPPSKKGKTTHTKRGE